MATAEEILASKAAIEENKKRSEQRAAQAAAEGNTARQQTWLASAARYQSLLDIKDRLAASASRQEQAAKDAEARRLAAIEAAKRAEEERLKREEELRKKYQNNPKPERSPGNYTPPSVEPIPLTPSTLSSTPSNISPVTQAPPPPPVKTAPIDTILFDEDAVPIQIMSDLIFENIGGQELINIARNDTVNGQQIIYQPIKNLTQIQQQYNPNNIVSLQATSDKYFQNFSIRFDNKVPTEGTGPDGSHVYIDPATGELVIEAVNLELDEQIEVEITTGGTIYEAEL